LRAITPWSSNFEGNRKSDSRDMVEVVSAGNLLEVLPPVQRHGCVVVVNDVQVDGSTAGFLCMLDDPLHQLCSNPSFSACKDVPLFQRPCYPIGMHGLGCLWRHQKSFRDLQSLRVSRAQNHAPYLCGRYGCLSRPPDLQHCLTAMRKDMGATRLPGNSRLTAVMKASKASSLLRQTTDCSTTIVYSWFPSHRNGACRGNARSIGFMARHKRV